MDPVDRDPILQRVDPEVAMTDSDPLNDHVNDQLVIVRLLDDRFRLREDPERQQDLELTHALLRERLRCVQDNDDA